jgi:hypothetical protein
MQLVADPRSFLLALTTRDSIPEWLFLQNEDWASVTPDFIRPFASRCSTVPRRSQTLKILSDNLLLRDTTEGGRVALLIAS